MIKGINLLSIEKCNSDRDEMPSGIEDVVDKIARLGGNLQNLSATSLKELLHRDIKECKEHQSKEILKKLYHEKVRPALVTRVLLLPYSLSDYKGIMLLEEYKKHAIDSKYLTSIDLMEAMVKMTELRLRGPTSAGSIRCRTVGGLEATVNGDGSAGVPGVGAKEKSSPAREGREAVAPPLG
jgi:hypothetical protein